MTPARAKSGLLALLLVSAALAQTVNPANDPSFTRTLPTTSERLQQLQQQLSSQQQLSEQQRQQLDTLRGRIAQLGEQQRTALDRIDALSVSIARLDTERRNLDLQIQTAQQQLRDLDLQIQGTEARVARLQTDVRELLNALYHERSGRYLQLMSQASSLSDLLIRVRYANYSGQHNVKVVQTLRAESQQLQAQRQERQKSADQLQALQQQQLQKLAALKQQRGEQNALVARLQQDQAGQQALATQNQAQQLLTAQSIESLSAGIVQERAQIEAERQRRLEEERRRREAELARIRAAQEAARREAARLAALRAQQAAQARARAQAAAQARAQQAREQARAQQAREQARAAAAAQQARAADEARQAQLAREQQALRDRQTQLESQQQQSAADLAPLPSAVGNIGTPLPGGQVTQAYNTAGPWTVLSGQPGAQVVAVAEGNVFTAAQYANLGWVVFVNHGPLVSAYFGLSQPLVNVGDRVQRGSPIGLVGGSPQFGPESMAFQLISVEGGLRRNVAPPF
ncbi:murein hydrolase activator EnvC family protein [Deinococcus sonorensis]|uniref:Peptidoglycan DD-metalloendopeptidase family protein n=2 Tax=Deinococcus sonorensis TaxID=309891 RepID=A0AAU7UBA5_9DEIO